ncbi:hypothetical protein VMCG_10135 [Cytospora schulzeri]|uniref:Uncharacterized protein n=1 Tax=Cytospora schulzeri TaxID=448051 RepID=A0A423VDD3_9PEZI|nr:hypothetical protein VMCG_10135 [Valsa malicola]
MDPSNWANRHEQLGVGDNKPTKLNPGEPREFGDDTLDTVPNPQKAVDGSDDIHDPGTPGSSSIKHAGNDAKWDTVAGTEIGDPNGRIPTARHTHEQLATARNDELAIAASKVAPGPSRSGYGDVTPGSSTTVRKHRNSNYAPGYEEAAQAVHYRSYEASGHHPNLLSHEPVTPLTEVPPDLDDHRSIEKGIVPPTQR